MKNYVIEGKIWVIRDEKGNPIDDIDTDQIFHNQHLAITNLEQMGQYAFGNLPGWEDFPGKAKPGDILVCGKNFGAGSSRQQAVDCFNALGIALIIAESFGAIYRRNAINSGFPILTCPDICSKKVNGVLAVQNSDVLKIDLVSGEIKNITRNLDIPGCQPVSRVQLDILEAGNLFNFGKKFLAGKLK